MASTRVVGSDVAQALSSMPSVPGAAAATALLAVLTGAALRQAYEAHEDKEHMEFMEQVNALMKKCYDEINEADLASAFGLSSIAKPAQGFPAPFQISEDKKTFTAIQMTDEDVEAIGTEIEPITDVTLIRYREYILNAIALLKEFYRKHKAHDGMRATIVYSLYYIEKTCLNFSGRDYDYVYVDIFKRFINGLGSITNNIHSQRFTRLDPVWANLNQAGIMLEAKQRAISIGDVVSELNSYSYYMSGKLIRSFIKFTLANQYWDDVPNALFDSIRLHDGEVEAGYVRDETFGGRITINDHPVIIQDSQFKRWLIWLLNYYEEGINPAAPMTLGSLASPAQLFTLPDLAKWKALLSKGRDRTAIEDRDFDLINAALDDLRAVFKLSENFVSRKSDSNGNANAEIVTDNAELVQRAEVLVSLATLVHQVISMQYFTNQLMRSIQQLGDIYVRNPKHFHSVFATLIELCDCIKKTVDQNVGLIKALTAIDPSARKSMKLNAQQQLVDELLTSLGKLGEVIESLGERVEQQRTAIASKYPDKDLRNAVISTMEEMANILGAVYALPSYTAPAASAAKVDAPQVAELPVVNLPSAAPIPTFADVPKQVDVSEPTRWQRFKNAIAGAVIAVLNGVKRFFVAIGSAIKGLFVKPEADVPLALAASTVVMTQTLGGPVTTAPVQAVVSPPTPVASAVSGLASAISAPVAVSQLRR